jgi:hypothetical protein
MALERHEFWSIAHNPDINAIERVSQRLKALVESGTRLGIAADRPPTPIRRATKRRIR